MAITAAAIIAGIGAVAGGTGSYLGAQGANRGQRQNRDFADRRQIEGMFRSGGAAFGLPAMEDLFAASDFSNPERTTAERREAMDRFLAAIANPDPRTTLGMTDALADQHRTGQAQVMGDFDAQSADLQAQYAQMLAQGLGLFGRAEGHALRGEQEATAFGRGASEAITRDVGRATTAADQIMRSSLAQSGFGDSTIAATNLGENRLRGAEIEGDLQRQLMDSILGHRAGARDRTIAAAGAGANFFGDMAGQNLGNQFSRAGQRTSLQLGGLTRQLGLDSQKMEQVRAMLSSGQFNPFLGQPSLPQSVGSPLGGALQTGGSGAMDLGSLLLARELFSKEKAA